MRERLYAWTVDKCVTDVSISSRYLYGFSEEKRVSVPSISMSSCLNTLWAHSLTAGAHWLSSVSGRTVQFKTHDYWLAIR